MERERDIIIRELRVFAILVRLQEIRAERNNVCPLNSVVYSRITEPNTTYLFTKTPEFKENYSFVSNSFNSQKHQQTFVKNCNKLKSKNRR